MICELNPVTFPASQGLNVNMMPVIFGDADTVPHELRGYLPLMAACSRLRPGSTAYLTVHESYVREGETQRRPGVHVEAPAAFGWGGGWGGCEQGLYMASSDGACRAWDCLRFDGDEHGAVREPACEATKMAPSRLYWLTDRTPHEALPSPYSGVRQFFRLVSEHVGGWFAEHNTPNPLGVQPDAPIIYGSKFA